MPLVNLESILTPAREQTYAVGAFNAINPDFALSIIGAAEELKSPVIINIAEVHFEFHPLKPLLGYITLLAKQSPVDICINLDHGLSIESLQNQKGAGFTGMMFDGSAYSLEENTKLTREAVLALKENNISVEAELGAVGGEEGGGLVGSANPDLFTNPQDAHQFVKETGVAALAVAIGNSHGHYKGEPKLDFKRLAEVRDAAAIPLVLHGGSGISDSDFKKAIQLGICKINFFTGMSQRAFEETENFMSGERLRYNDYLNMIECVKGGIKEVVQDRIKCFGSEGKNG